MEIIKYQDAYKQQVIDLILHIQNSEAKINRHSPYREYESFSVN